MKVFLMQRERDFDAQQPLPPQADALTQDLELSTLFNAMAGGGPERAWRICDDPRHA